MVDSGYKNCYNHDSFYDNLTISRLYIYIKESACSSNIQLLFEMLVSKSLLHFQIPIIVPESTCHPLCFRSLHMFLLDPDRLQFILHISTTVFCQHVYTAREVPGPELCQCTGEWNFSYCKMM